MKRNLIWAAVIVALMMLVTACGEKVDNNANDVNETSSTVQGAGNDAAADNATEEIVINHLLGETTVKKNPQTVVVFDFGILDSLDKLGVEVAGVPQANIPPYLAQYEDAKYTNVGSLKEPDFETIYGLKPDLIIISGRQMEAYDELSNIAPTVYMGVDNEDYMGSFTENMRLLGKIFDKEATIEEELAAIEEGIAQLAELASEKEIRALVVLSNGGKVSAYGPGSRFGLIHDVFGLTPADDNIEASTHGMSISFEYIVEKDPDYLFVIDRDSVVASGDGSNAAQQVIENELVKKTKAYQEGQIVYLDPNYWYLSGGGLVSVGEMVKGVLEGIQ